MIKAFGKKVSREKAFQIIINEFMCAIVYARDYDELENLLQYGWKALEEWSNKDLEDYIDGLCIENQPDRNI